MASLRVQASIKFDVRPWAADDMTDGWGLANCSARRAVFAEREPHNNDVVSFFVRYGHLRTTIAILFDFLYYTGRPSRRGSKFMRRERMCASSKAPAHYRFLEEAKLGRHRVISPPKEVGDPFHLLHWGTEHRYNGWPNGNRLRKASSACDSPYLSVYYQSYQVCFSQNLVAASLGTTAPRVAAMLTLLEMSTKRLSVLNF